jgi:ABC-type transporter Mla subunit MlaD
MAVEKSYARLGLFIVVTLAVVLATALFFIQRMKSREVIAAVTYINENVSGLDISSPVRYRGVPIGRVADVRVDPNGVSIEVDFELFRDRLVTIGLNTRRIEELASTAMFKRLRARVVSNPVTGESYLLLDLLESPPPPISLGFTPNRPYVPSMPSMISKVEDRLPEVLERAEAMLHILKEIATRIPDSIDRSDRFLTNVERILQESQLPTLSADTRRFLTTTSEQLAHIEQVKSELARLVETAERIDKLAEQTRAMMKETNDTINAADLPATTKVARETLDSAMLAADDLRHSLPAIRHSLEQVRQLAQYLEDEPESVVHGPRPSGAKPK